MSLEEYNFLKYLSDPANCFASWVQQFVAGNCQIGGNTFVAPTATFTLSPSSYVSTSPQNIILGINVTPNDGQAISWTVTSADNLFTYTTSDLGEIGTLVQLTDATLRTTVGFVYYTLTVEYLDTNADPFSFTLNKNMQITAPLAFAQVGAARSISSPSILSYSIIGRNNALGYVSDVPEMGLASVADEYRFSTTGDLLGEYVDNVRDNVTLLNRLNLTKSEMTAGFVLEAKANNGAASVQIVMLIPKSFGAPTKFVVAGFADDTRNWQYEDTGGNLQWNRVQDDDFYYYYHAIYQTAGSLFNYRLEF
jgi:hypothetical protein